MASQQPPCSWAQRKAIIFLTIDLLNTKGDVTFDAKAITFKGTGQKAGQDEREWNLNLDLVDEIVPAECSFTQSDRCIEIVAAKKDKEAEYWEKLVALPGKVTKSWLTTNWALYCEEDVEAAMMRQPQDKEEAFVGEKLREEDFVEDAAPMFHQVGAGVAEDQAMLVDSALVQNEKLESENKQLQEELLAAQQNVKTLRRAATLQQQQPDPAAVAGTVRQAKNAAENAHQRDATCKLMQLRAECAAAQGEAAQPKRELQAAKADADAAWHESQALQRQAAAHGRGQPALPGREAEGQVVRFDVGTLGTVAASHFKEPVCTAVGRPNDHAGRLCVWLENGLPARGSAAVAQEVEDAAMQEDTRLERNKQDTTVIAPADDPEHFISHVDAAVPTKGKAKFADLVNAAEQPQQAGIDVVVSKIVGQAQQMAELLPVGDAIFASITEVLKTTATDKLDAQSADELKLLWHVALAKGSLSRKLAALANEIQKDNETRSYDSVQQCLHGVFEAESGSFNFNPSSPDDDPEARFVSHVDAAVQEVEDATRDCVASASRDRAIDDFKKEAESSRELVRECARSMKEQHAAMEAFEQSRLAIREEKEELMIRQAQLAESTSQKQKKREKLAKQLKEDNKRWEEKAAAAMQEHDETCARLREGAKSLHRQKLRVLQEKQDKANAERQAKLAAETAAVAADAAAKRLSKAARELEAAMLRHARKMEGCGVEEVVKSFFKATPPEELSSLLNVGTAGKRAAGKRAAVVTLTATDETGRVLCASGVHDFTPAVPPFSRFVEWGRLDTASGGTIVLSAAVPLLARCSEEHLRSLPASVQLVKALSGDGLAGDAGAKVKLLCRAEQDMAGCLGSVDQPRKLIALTEGEQLTMLPEVAERLKKLPGPFYIVSMVGAMRIGKSFLLSALVRLLTGRQDLTFGVSKQTKTYTKGVDYCAAPHPDGGTVLFLDVEGEGSTDRSRVYDNVLFSTVFLLSSAVLFNCRGIPNSATVINSLECAVEVAQATADQGESVQTKRLHVVCRDTNYADKDDDADYRNDLLENTKKDRAATTKGFFNYFSCVALHLIGCPMNNPGALATGLEHRRFEEYCPLFATGLSRLASVVARDLKKSSPLAMLGFPIPDGAALFVMLQGLLSSSENGKAKFANLGSTAEMLQQTGMDAAVKKFAREAEAEAERKAALLPVRDAGLEVIAEELKKAAMTKFYKKPFVVVDELKVVPAEDELNRRLTTLVKRLRKDNEARSYDTVQQRLREEDGKAAPASFNFDPSAPDDDPEARFVSHVNAVVQEVEAATRDCVASASRDRAINDFKKEAESRRELVRESAWFTKRQHAAMTALEQGRLAMEEEKEKLNEREAELLRDTSLSKSERKKLAQQLKEDNKRWEEKASAERCEHHETCARLRLEGDERCFRKEISEEKKLQEVRREAGKEGAEHQEKLKKHIEAMAKELKEGRESQKQLENKLDALQKRLNPGSSCFTGDAWAALACGGRKAVCDVQVGDLLASPSGEAARVLFVDVTQLGPRRLMGLNGRAAHITDDHPVPSADGEVLLFADVARAVASRHWKKAGALAAGALVGTQGGVEEVTEVRLCEAGPETVVYDILADKETFYVDGLLVRSDSPPVDDYPLEALALAEAAGRVARCAAVRSVHSDVRLPKPAVFDRVAEQVEAALRGVAATRRRERAGAADGNNDDADDDVTSTFAGSEAVALLVRRRKDEVFGTIAEGGQGGVSLAWCMARLWARTLPLLRVIMQQVSSVHDLDPCRRRLSCSPQQLTLSYFVWGIVKSAS